MLNELTYAARRLRARPWSVAIVIAIFAIGSGSALTVFRVADAVLLRALPYRDAARLVRIDARVPLLKGENLPFADVGYRAQERRTRTLQSVAAYRLAGVNLVHGETLERVISARVTGNFFDVLGLRVARGPGFREHQETEKGPVLIVLSDGLWRRGFGARTDVIGSTVRVDGASATIVGVADPALSFPSADVGLFTLMDLDVNGTEPFRLGIEVVARVRAGVSFDAVAADASRIVREVARENPGPHSTPTSDYSGFAAVVRPLRDDMAGGVKPTLALLLAAVVFVVALTCVNVATLELVRSSARREELAVRAALGAGRRRLIGGALFEGGIQSFAGCVGGVLLSTTTVRLLQRLLPASFGTDTGPAISPAILAAFMVTTIVSTAAAGVFPVLASVRSDVQSALRGRAGSASRGAATTRRALITIQLSFACLLVNSAALMILTVRDAQRVEPGFAPDGLLTFRVSLPIPSYRGGAAVATAYRSLVDQLRAIPGASSVALASTLPLDAEFSTTLIGVEGRPFKADGTDPDVDERVVSASYFSTMGVPLVAGRAFSEGDAYLDGTPVVISKGAAALLWPDGSDPIGHRIRTGPFVPWMTIIGVARDTHNRSLTLPARPEIYLPFAAPRSPLGVSRDMSFVIRTTPGVRDIRAAAQRVVARANPDLPVYAVHTYGEIIAASQVREMTTMRALTAFACVALALAIAGSYAMLMFSVLQRRRELALRRAVGATYAGIVELVGREMAALLVIGVGSGLGLALLSSRLLSHVLGGQSTLDVRATLATVAIVCVAGLGAAVLPALRAASVDAMSVLRAD